MAKLTSLKNDKKRSTTKVKKSKKQKNRKIKKLVPAKSIRKNVKKAVARAGNSKMNDRKRRKNGVNTNFMSTCEMNESESDKDMDAVEDLTESETDQEDIITMNGSDKSTDDEEEEENYIDVTHIGDKNNNTTGTVKKMKKRVSFASNLEKNKPPKKKVHNFAYDEPDMLNQIELIDMTREKQIQIFDQTLWHIAKDIKTVNIDVDKWFQTTNSRNTYFFGEDEVSFFLFS